MAKEIITFWKGSAEGYATLKLRGRIKPYTRYVVTDSDGIYHYAETWAEHQEKCAAAGL